jgi:hypothetical protein
MRADHVNILQTQGYVGKVGFLISHERGSANSALAFEVMHHFGWDAKPSYPKGIVPEMTSPAVIAVIGAASSEYIIRMCELLIGVQRDVLESGLETGLPTLHISIADFCALLLKNNIPKLKLSAFYDLFNPTDTSADESGGTLGRASYPRSTVPILLSPAVRSEIGGASSEYLIQMYQDLAGVHYYALKWGLNMGLLALHISVADFCASLPEYNSPNLKLSPFFVTSEPTSTDADESDGALGKAPRLSVELVVKMMMFVLLLIIFRTVMRSIV